MPRLSGHPVDRFLCEPWSVRADRLVAALLILQARGRVTAAGLAEELEISERTARRDLEALAMAGIPVYSQAGRGGGWSLLGGARTDLSGLTAAEARTLFLVAGPSAAATPQIKAASAQARPRAARTVPGRRRGGRLRGGDRPDQLGPCARPGAGAPGRPPAGGRGRRPGPDRLRGARSARDRTHGASARSGGEVVRLVPRGRDGRGDADVPRQPRAVGRGDTGPGGAARRVRPRGPLAFGDRRSGRAPAELPRDGGGRRRRDPRAPSRCSERGCRWASPSPTDASTSRSGAGRPGTSRASSRGSADPSRSWIPRRSGGSSRGSGTSSGSATPVERPEPRDRVLGRRSARPRPLPNP